MEYKALLCTKQLKGINTMFTHAEINFDLLRNRAFNLRWAAVENDVIPLTAADPDFPCAPQIAEAIAQYAKDRYFSYAPAEGYAFFKEAVAQFHHTKRHVAVQPQHVLAVDSAAFGIYAVCKAFLNPGDEAIVFNPVDFLFKYAVEAHQAQAITFPVPTNPELELDYALLEQLITPKTKLLCLCNPLNPTGKVFNAHELQRIGQIAVKHNLIILSDEIWSDIVFEPNTYVSVASISEEIRNQTVLVTGYSKSYGLAGLRVGAIIAPNDELYQTILEKSGHQATIHGCNVLAQVAASTALNDCQLWLSSFVTHLTAMRNYCVTELNSISGINCYTPQGCYLVFPNISQTGFTAQQVQTLLLSQAKVAVVPGLPQWFGSRADGHIRLSFATSKEVLEESFSRIKRVLK